MTGWLAASALLIAAVSGARGTWSPCGLSMISAINPLSERSRGNRYSLTALWFIAGSVLGGVVLGAASGVLALAARPLADQRTAALAVAVLACLIALAADRRLAGFQLPLHPRQVNELWLTRYRRWLYAAGFGLQIGVGFATYIMTAATYLVVVLAALTGSPALAVAAGAVFGLVRGLAVLLSARCRSAQALRQLHLRLSALEPVSLRTAMAAEALVAGILGYAAAGVVAGGAALLAAGLILTADQALRPIRGRALMKSRHNRNTEVVPSGQH
jgi:MFS family permease